MNIKHNDTFSDEVDVENGNENVNLNDDNGNSNDNDAYSIDDDDECVIEDCDEDSDEDSVTQRVSMKVMFDESEEEKYNIHDQLPSVEEIKSSQAYMNSARIAQKSNRNKLYVMIAAAAFAAMMVSVAITIGVYKSANKEQIVEPTVDVNAEIGARIEDTIQFIFENSISSLPDMRMKDSPEYRAVLFMAYGDGFHSKMRDVNMAERRRFVERYILTLVYYQTNGVNWSDRYDFLSPKDHCDWHKTYSVAEGHVVRGVQCNSDKLIKDIDLSHNNLVSTAIPYELSHIKYLERLHLFKNDIAGIIPNLAKLTNLKSLGLMDLELKGTIPSWLGDMTSLTTLALGHTKMLSTTIPESFAQLTNLRILGLEGLSLTGKLNPTLKLRKLEALYLEDNFLSGELYDSEWTNMKELDLSNNVLNALIPKSLIMNKNLHIVDLHHNSIFGSFPDEIFNNDAMVYFDIRENQIAGSISDRIGYLNKMQHFDVSGNKLTGTIPDTIQLMTNLISLRTSGNNFGPQIIKDFFTPLKSLRELALRDNSFSGPLPNYFANLQDLQMLDLEGNNFNGVIPTFYGLMSNLSILKLNHNQIFGTIPSELSSLGNLKVLLLNNNRLEGKTNEICAATNQNLIQFTSDCYPSMDSDTGAEVTCNCCTLCCNDENTDCNDKVSGDFTKNWSVNYDSKIPHGDIYSAYTTTLDQASEGWENKVLEKATSTESLEQLKQASF